MAYETLQINSQNTTMENVSSNKGWMTGMTHPHLDPPPIPHIQETHDGKSDKDFVKLKLRRDPTLYTSDLYEFKCLCLTMAIQREFYCLFVTSIRPSWCQVQWRRERNINTFVI